MNKKRITLLINGLGSGGAEGVCVTLANSLVAKNIEVDLVVLSLQNSIKQNDLDHKVNLINLNTQKARNSFWHLKNYIQNNKVEKILVFNFQLAIILVWIRYLFKLKFKIIARNINTLSEVSKNEKSIWHKHVTHFLAKLFYGKVDLVICQSLGMAEDLTNNYNFDQKNIVVINNPVNAKIEKYINENKELIKKNQGQYLLFIGRLEKQKGLHFLLKAFSQISNQEISLKIIGEGSLKADLIKLSQQLNIDKRVIFEGYQEDVIPYILNAKAVVLTSLYEGFPNVLIEAISLGTPIVAFDCKSGPREIIEDGINGYLVKYLDTEDLTKKLNKVLEQSFDRYQVMETAKQFSPEYIITKYHEALF